MSLIHISDIAYKEIRQQIEADGHILVPQKPSAAVSEPISMHPDIFMCKLGSSPKSPVFHGNADNLSSVYPGDVPYNAVITEKYIICNKNTVNTDLIGAATSLYPEIEMICVKQGYTKCNIIVVDENSFITEDVGIFKAIEQYRIQKKRSRKNFKLPECLLVREGHVRLSGYNRGFIGGCSGRIGDTIWFNGDIYMHPDHESIISFIEKRGIAIKSIKNKPLIDIGSIIEEQ